MRPQDVPPVIADARASQLLLAMLERIATDYPDWKPGLAADAAERLRIADDPRDFGMALLKLAAHLGETVAGQINRIPQKTFLAFLDFLGMDRRPPRAARVPLTFTLSQKAPADRLVPRGTQVGAARREDVVFETETDLLVTRAVVAGAWSVDVAGDRYADLGVLVSQPGAREVEVFGPSGASPDWVPDVHALYIGHETLFASAALAGAPVTIDFSLAQGALPELSWSCSVEGGGGWQPVTAIPVQPGGSAFSLDLAGIAPRRVEGPGADGAIVGRTSSWVRARAAHPESALIHRAMARAQIAVPVAGPWIALANGIALDTSKDFLPFGERPRLGDTLHIACAPAFAAAGTMVSLTVTLSAPLARVANPVELQWEYWDGQGWAALGTTSQNGVITAGPAELSDSTNAFTQPTGTVRFRCPVMVPATIAGITERWVRVRIAEGDYGAEAGYRPSANAALLAELRTIETDDAVYSQVVDLLARNALVDTVVYVQETYAVPSIQSLVIGYAGESSTDAVAVLTENSFTWRDETGRASFEPFVRWDESAPALYLEFDGARTPAGTPVSMYVRVAQRQYGTAPANAAIGAGGLPALVWRYWNGADWARLPAEDETFNLTRSGLLRFITPAGARERRLFGRSRLWIRGSLESGGYAAPPRLAALTINTVWARHGVSFRDHVLGSSNGDPGQAFRFAKAPVLEGQVVEIREPAMPTEADRQRIVADEGRDAIRTVKDAAGNVTQVWVRWHGVTTLNLSTPSDRHYVVDRATGALLFGDGVQGRIPPAGRENVVARSFRAGGGAAGNNAARTLTDLKTSLAYIDAVVNHEPAFGGADQDSVEEVAVSGPLRVKSRDRAVTAEDFQWLAREAAGEVARALCLPMTKPESLWSGRGQGADLGWVTLVVVPQGDEDQPLPTEQLVDGVRRYVTARALATLAPRIAVIGPRYVPIDVEAVVVPRRIEEAKAVEKRVLDNVRAFLHPLSGGPDGDGWEFGRAIHLSEVAAVVQGSEGVDRVRSVVLRQAGSAEPRTRVALDRNDLPASGRHAIVATGA